MLTLSFMRHAFIASTFIAIICGIIGVFVVARNLSFLTHTLSEIGFAGGAFAVFAGWPALNGMILFTMFKFSYCWTNEYKRITTRSRY